MISINELVLAMKRLQKVPDDTRLQKIAEVLDEDDDGQIRISHVLRVGLAPLPSLTNKPALPLGVNISLKKSTRSLLSITDYVNICCNYLYANPNAH